MQLLNQPANGQMGEVLKEQLSSKKYDKFILFSAFAKDSGVLRMKTSFEDFRKEGGKIFAFVGLDAHGTSYEAVVNLFNLCDELYIVHDKSLATTFHSKVYYLEKSGAPKWMAVGSNNLTGGGLWTNIETSVCFDVDKTHSSLVTEFQKALAEYMDPACVYSMKINTLDDIKKLKDCDLLRSEMEISISSRSTGSTRPKASPSPFGSKGTAVLPKLKNKPAGPKIKTKKGKGEITAINPVTPSSTSERMWAESRKLTGGSRNILDLSMLGNIQSGTAKGTKYETTDPSYILGSVAFFDVDPSKTSTKKSIIINYGGDDYVGCDIEFTANNGSWRMHLSGANSSGDKLTSAAGRDWMVDKLLVFEKISTNYYSLSVLDVSDMVSLKSISTVVATNGSAPGSKQFGLII